MPDPIRPFRPLRIALMGTRGIPASYGGFETFAEELSVRLVARGHTVTVYGRRPFLSRKAALKEYRGVRLVQTPTIYHKYLETPLHSLTSFIDLLFRNYDVALLCNAANSPFSFFSRIRGVPLLINVDGIERKRAKWNALGRAWYLLGELTSVLFASKVVADAEIIAEYYREKYRIESAVIAYGATPNLRPPGAVMAQFGLKPKAYFLYVSRLEPENNALGVIEAYEKLKPTIPLVVVGDAPYADEYKASLKKLAGPGVIFTGFQFGDAYQELRTNCFAYIQATEVGGTHPALVEAMAYGNCVIANDVPEHREVLGDAGLYYSKNDFLALATQMGRVLEDTALVEELRARAGARAQSNYSWETIVDKYERLMLDVTAQPLS